MPKTVPRVKHSPKAPGTHISIQMVNITTEVSIRHCSRLNVSKMTIAVFSVPHAFLETSTPHQEMEPTSPPLLPGWGPCCSAAPEAGSQEGPSFLLVRSPAHSSLSGCIFGALNPLGKSPALEVTVLETPCGKTTNTERERWPRTPSYPAARRSALPSMSHQPSCCPVFRFQTRRAPERNKRLFSPLSLGVGYYTDTVTGPFTQGV